MTIEAALSGFLGRDPEHRATKTGKAMTSASIGVEGHGEEDTQWVRIVAFGDAAKPLEGLKKGEKVYAEGRLKLETWVKDGEARHGLTLVAWRVFALGQIGRRRPRQAAELDSAAA